MLLLAAVHCEPALRAAVNTVPRGDTPRWLRSMGAYEVLSHLDASGFGAQPPVAYRALDFLVKHGFAHKVEAMNAYVACSHPGAQHVPAFLICRQCSTVQETQIEPMQNGLGDAAHDAGFAIERAVVEAQGLCPLCQQSAPE